MFARFCAALIISAAAPYPAFAWSEAGHRMICRIAWVQLSQPAETGLRALLGIASIGEFADACAGADLAGHPDPAAWHQITVPKSARDVEIARDCPAATGCALREFDRHLGVLKSAAPREERAAALTRLAHALGDIHQPLRVAFAEDRGGADISVSFLGRASNLRALWDSEMLDTDPAGLETLEKTYNLYTPLDRLFVDWIDDPPVAWANESLWIMRTPATGYVGNPGGLEFDQTYVKQNLNVAHERIAKAGMRLGHVLNQVFQPPK